VDALHAQGVAQANLYGADDSVYGGLNAFFLLMDKPEVYGLPDKPKLGSRNLWPGSTFSIIGAAAIGLLGLLGFRQRRMNGAGARGLTAGGEGGGDAL
jgi:formate dehydrogenase iron-sulfur subunit